MTLDDKLQKMLDKLLEKRLDTLLEARLEKMLGAASEPEAALEPDDPSRPEPEPAKAGKGRGTQTASGGPNGSSGSKPADKPTNGHKPTTEPLKPRIGTKIPRTTTRVGDVMHERRIIGLGGRAPSGIRMVKVECLKCLNKHEVNIGSWRHGGCLKCSAAKKGPEIFSGFIDNAKLILSAVRAHMVGKGMTHFLGSSAQFKVMCGLGYDPRIVGRAFQYLEVGKVPDIKMTAKKQPTGNEVLWSVGILPDK